MKLWWRRATNPLLMCRDLDACYFRATRLVRPDFPGASIRTGFADCLRRVATVYGITADDREFVAAPLFHEAPTLFALCQLFCGGTVIVTSDTTPANVFGMIDRYKATWASWCRPCGPR
jgi:acyl-CoA synthetase (AMP-forming)/AMP-acid ligase II